MPAPAAPPTLTSTVFPSTSGRGADAEEGFLDLVLVVQAFRPDFRPGLQVVAGELACRAERKHPTIGDHRRRTRAVALAVIVLVGRGHRGTPEWFPGGGGETFDDVVVTDAVEENETIGDDTGPA